MFVFEAGAYRKTGTTPLFPMFEQVGLHTKVVTTSQIKVAISMCVTRFRETRVLKHHTTYVRHTSVSYHYAHNYKPCVCFHLKPTRAEKPKPARVEKPVQLH